MTEDVQLTRAEVRHLEQRRRDAERRAAEDTGQAPRSVRARMQRAVDVWSLETGWVAVGLTSATATIPPTVQGDRVRRGSGPSDPTGAVLFATLDTVGREAEAWAHLTGPCARDGLALHDACCGTTALPGCRGRVHDCLDGHAVDVADLGSLVLDPETVVDSLLGTPPSSRAWADACSTAAAWHSTAAAQVLELFQQAWRDGAEPAHLDAWATATERLARKVAALAGRLAAWSGRTEAQCASCGGARPQGRNHCGRCRTAAWRDRQEGA